jgi:hypothetical protein
VNIAVLWSAACVFGWLGSAAAADRELAGRVLPTTGVPGQPRRLVVSLVPAAEARVRWENFRESAISNRAATLASIERLSVEREAVEQEKTRKVYRTHFSEVGPAEKEAIREEVEALNRRLTAVQNEVAKRSNMLTNWTRAGSLFRQPWTNVLASSRCAQDGSFRLKAPAAGNVWLAAWPAQNEEAGEECPGWLLAWPESRGFLWLASSNSVKGKLNEDALKYRP